VAFVINQPGLEWEMRVLASGAKFKWTQSPHPSWLLILLCSIFKKPK
jgi:hypothetical protein